MSRSRFPEPMVTKRYCGNCLSELDEGKQKCPRCGSALPSRAGVGAGASSTSAASSGGPSGGQPGGTLSGYTTRGSAVSPPLGQDLAGAVDAGDGLRGDTVGDFRTAGSAITGEVSDSWCESQLVAGRFRLSRCLGQGGMGKVFLARDEILGRPIALKRVPQEIIFDSDARDDLRQEANRLLDLAHENIIRVHTYYDEPDWPFFAMEYLRGPTLKKLLHERKQRNGLFSFDELLVIVRQVGRGLSYAHEKNLIHRDLKPANLMFVSPPRESITEEDTIKITDFGISRVVADSTLRQTGRRSGTLPYMSPEQFRGEECTRESDVYSLAATYYELLSGTPPFYTGDIGYQVLNMAPRPLSGVPRGVNEVLLRALSKNPRHRFGSVNEFTRALERRKTIPDCISLPRFLKKYAGIVGAVAAMVLLIVLAGLGSRYLFLNWFGSTTVAGGGSPADDVGSILRNTSFVFQEFALNLQKQLDREIPYLVSTRDLVFKIKREGMLEKSPEVFGDIYFILDPGRRDEEIGGEIVAGGMVQEFHLEDLDESPHLIRLALREDSRARVSLPTELHIERSFEVDVSGPSFQIAPLRQEAFVKVDSDSFSTFGESCEFRLVTPLKTGDIDTAFYQVVKLGRREEMRPGGTFHLIEDPLFWKIHLSEGLNLLHVIAKDHLGNESAREELRITRLRLSVDAFEVDRGTVLGNQVTVGGRLNVEGDEIPPLHFFVNENRVIVPMEDQVKPTREDSRFSARLLLPRYTNTVEVRYEWGGEIFSFALSSASSPPSVISDIRVQAPAITLAPELEERTRENSYKISGKVQPYFEGLKIWLSHKGVGNHRVGLQPGSDSATADFSQTIWLAPDKTNEIKFTCEYDGQILEPELPPHRIYCDMQKPELIEPMQFDPLGIYLHVRIEPTEELLQLRIREGDEGDWKLLVQEPDGSYLYVTTLPVKDTPFTVELTDRVGNTNEIIQVCDVYDPEGVAPGPDHERLPVTISPAVHRDEENLEPSRAFLREIGLEFRGYGFSGEEMGTTEVPERAWNRYLRETGRRAVSEGSLEMPVVIGDDFDEKELLGFIRWLNEKCGDGYEYYIPGPEQWMASFTGSTVPEEALRDIESWFRGDRAGGRHFIWNPRELYGQDRVLPVGSRQENRTVTGLLDMESNLQEVVRDREGRWLVIGGYNSLREYLLGKHCIKAQELTLSLEDHRRKFTGLRLARRRSRE